MHPFHHIQCGRTIFNILFVSTCNVQFEIVVLCMRKTTTIFRTNRIDRTLVIFFQKLAGNTFVHDVTCLIKIKVFVKILLITHFQVLRNPLYIRLFICWRHRLATVCAFKAINPLKSLFMQGFCKTIQSPNFTMCYAPKKSDIGFLLLL